MDATILARLERWRQKLLDLGKRNQLINFRPRRTSTIQIVGELPSEVFRSLAIQGRRMSFGAVEADDEAEPEENGASDLIDAETFEAYEIDELHHRHLDDVLQTNLPQEKLAKNLLYIERQATSSIEEQGYNVLYLALGMLEWFEAKSSDVRLRSPLVLIPVQLKRDAASKPFQLFPYDDEPIVNPALARRLELEFGITLGVIPDDYEGWDPQTIFTEVSAKCPDIDPRWRVTTDIYLGLYSFSKYLMYKDIEAHGAAFAAAPLIARVCGGVEVAADDPLAGVDDLDPLLPPAETYQILDADSSQQAAILRVKAGQDLVIEGPPGTGKSQTIANIIAESLATNKSVLFVSEKMAALEVVFRRLQQAGLGDFCLELHSRKANKRELAHELGRCLELDRPALAGHESEHRKLEQLRGQLTAYARDVHAPVGAIALSPYQLYGRLASLADVPGLTIALEDIAGWTQEDFDEVTLMLARLGTALERVGNPEDHPWRGSGLTETHYELTVRVPRLLDSFDRGLTEIVSRWSTLADLCNVPPPATLAEAEELVAFSRVLAAAPESTPLDLLLSPNWNTLPENAVDALDSGDRYASLASTVLSNFQESLLAEDLQALVAGQRSYGRNTFRFFSSRFRRDRQLLKRHLRGTYKISSKSLLTDLEAAAEMKSLSAALDANPTATALFGSHWRGRDSDWLRLRELAEWLVRYRQMLVRNSSREGSAGLLNDGVLERARVSKAADKVVAALELLRARWSEFAEETAMDEQECFGGSLDGVDGSFIEARIKEMSRAIPELEAWTLYVSEWQIVDEAGYGGLVEELSELTDQARENLVPAFQKHFYSLLLDTALRSRLGLKRFDGLAHEEALKEFRRLDALQLQSSRDRLRAMLAERRPDFEASVSSQSETGIIKREAKKQKRHLPIRKLFEQASGAILRLKPCLLMSPLSVAQFLDPSRISFDLVIFDEASQVAPEDAIGAIARGKQLVVVGDSKQLPPTDFFQRQVDDTIDDDEIDQIPADLQSILDECATVMPGTMLRWHYRSVHESLIAFSNRNFYAGGLHTFPSPVDDPAQLGASFNFVRDGIYDAGKSRTNRIEARRVAEYLVQVLTSESELSVGVGTFSQAQQTAVLDELEHYRRENPAIDARFNYEDPEHVFVKNLENIQGDERDVIIISVGYGRDEQGRFSHNFGPLNAAGGDRRLNVLVTRARRRLAVFSSVTADDVDLGRTQSIGASLLKRYLAFAERGDPALFDVAEAELNFSESDFEEAVYRVLTQRGLDVRKQVGCSSYRIDLAVVDPAQSGRYLLGIECDGASYHSSRTSRDRDRLRQEVLERLGWTIHRIWSTDWFRNPNREVERVLDALRSAKPPVPPAPVTPPVRVVTPCVAKPTAPGPRMSPNGKKVVVPEYVLCKPRLEGSASDFYEAPASVLKSVLLEVVEVEGPIHRLEAIRRVAAHWTLSKAGSRIVERVGAVISAALRGEVIAKRGDFLWPAGMETPPVRSRVSEGHPLGAELIAPEEIAEAMILVLRNELGLPEVELLRQTSRVLGFKAMSEQIKASMANGLCLLIEQQRAIRDRERVRVP